MQSLWNDSEAAACGDDLALRVYTSRLLGREPSLVLHGGGNTSVKITQPDRFGEPESILYVKGSGWDLATIEAAGFAPVRLAPLIRLATLDHLSDPEMVNALRSECIHADAPAPSVEAILHAVLPYRYVDHTHADAVVTISNSVDGADRIAELYGDSVVIIPYVMPGFDLARVCARRFAAEAHAGTVGMVLLNHGLFTFGDSAEQAYQRMIDLVDRAERYLQQQQAWALPWIPTPSDAAAVDTLDRAALLRLATLRQRLSAVAGKPLLLQAQRDARSRYFAHHPALARISQQGPATPDHIIRTKQLPLLGDDIDAYVEAYQRYFARHAPYAAEPKQMLDPAPRLLIDSTLGVVSIGASADEAMIVADIYAHTIDVILRAEQLGGYQALPEADLFAMEYWDLEQAKLRRGGTTPPLRGEVVLITGGASGIGRAAVDTFLAQGAAVIALDIDPAIRDRHQRRDYLGLQVDVRDEAALEQAVWQGVAQFGGIDMVLLNAGIFPAGCRVAELDSGSWQQVMAINLDANLNLLRLSHPLLCRAPKGGRVVVIGSKNVPAPGPGAAAYSAAKAALNQLARVTALEWAADHIRINSLHPNAVFDTAIWSDEVLTARAAHYGVTVAEYKSRNLLGVEVTSHDVAALAAAMCGPLFRCTTGAQLPIDGGNERVI